MPVTPELTLLALAAIFTLLSCDETSPFDVGDPRIIADGIVADTVESEGRILVRVAGPESVVDRVLVRFRPIWLDGDRAERPFQVSIASSRFGQWRDELTLWTVEGRTQARVLYGTLAGDAGMEVSVESLALVDTLVAPVLPGSVDTVFAQPGDTIVHIGDDYPFQVAAADRHLNPVSDHPLEWRILADGIEVDTAQGRVRGTEVGIARMEWYSDVVHRIVEVAVVPEVTLAHNQQGPIVLRNLAGDEVRELMSDERIEARHPGPQHAWSLDGALLAYVDSDTIWVDDLAGTRTPVAEGTEMGALSWTADAQWVYFTSGGRTWRAATDGSGVELVVDDGIGRVSPDGQRLALARGESLLLYDLSTGATSLLHEEQRAFGWSPDGSRLFVATPGRMDIVGLDGSVLQSVDQPRERFQQVVPQFSDAAFTPDNRLLVAEAALHLHLLDLVDGRLLRSWLPGTLNASDPSIAPGARR